MRRSISRSSLGVLVFLSGGLALATEPVPGEGNAVVSPPSRLMRAVLSDLQTIEEVPAQVITGSAFGPLPIRKAIVARREEFHDRMAMREQVSENIEATCTSIYRDSNDGLIQGGYEITASRNGSRQKVPFVAVVRDNNPPLPCDVELASELPDVVLTAVLAIDADHLYLEGRGSTGDTKYFTAKYRIEAADGD